MIHSTAKSCGLDAECLEQFGVAFHLLPDGCSILPHTAAHQQSRTRKFRRHPNAPLLFGRYLSTHPLDASLRIPAPPRRKNLLGHLRTKKQHQGHSTKQNKHRQSLAQPWSTPARPVRPLPTCTF